MTAPLVVRRDGRWVWLEIGSLARNDVRYEIVPELEKKMPDHDDSRFIHGEHGRVLALKLDGVEYGIELLRARLAGYAALQTENARLRAALEDIRQNEGRVCQDYALCTHKACRSSYHAWEIADAARTSAPAGERRG